MTRRIIIVRTLQNGVAAAAVCMGLAACSPSTPDSLLSNGDKDRGAVLAAAADCAGCHSDPRSTDKALSGGPPLKTSFGVFYAPNITSDKTHGIGAWTPRQFHRALREGRGKNGQLLYPAFPYASFSGMTDRDIADLWAYMQAMAPSARPNRNHQLKFPYNLRPLLLGWRLLYFRSGPMEAVPSQDAAWNRGRYLVESVAHCQECHSPRTALGGIDRDRAYTGNPTAPDNQSAPNITASAEGIGDWTDTELDDMLVDGVKPDGDYVAGAMALVVAGTSQLDAADRRAMITYLRSVAGKTTRKTSTPH